MKIALYTIYTQKQLKENMYNIISMSERIVGRVKWFNSKSGFGFITVISGSRAGEDIFAHYSSVRGEQNQYKTLIQGEYVEFILAKSESEQHEYHATDISGIQGGMLMCDTQKANMPTKPIVATQPHVQRQTAYKPRFAQPK